MAITSSAKKAVKSSARKRVVNLRRLRAMRGAIKDTRALVAKGASPESVEHTQAKLSLAYKAIDKAAKRGVIKKNTAARKKSRLTRALAKTN